VFKWLAGPLIDAVTIPRFGRRRPWIVFAQAMMAVTLAALVIVRDPADASTLLLALVLLHTVFNAIQNVAVDGLAIDLIDPEERGRVNGFMYGSKWAGGIVGGAGMAAVTAHFGFDAAIAMQVVLLVAILMLPLLVHERSGPPPPRPEPREMWRAFARIYRLRSPWLALLSMLLASIAGGVLSVAAPRLFEKQLGWTAEEYAVLGGGIGLFIGFVGSITGGMLADIIGHRLLAAIASLVMALGWIVFALGEPWWNHRVFIYAIGIGEPFTNAILIVSLWSVCMSVSLKRTAATQFAAYTSLTSLSVIIGTQLLAGRLMEHWSYQHIYIAAGLFQGATVVILPFIDPGQVRRELGDA
jgi:PAT family beta-lactamase induction signal transducer AmpG